MIELFIALNKLLNLAAVAGALGTIDAGLNIASLIVLAKSQVKKDSLAHQLLCVFEITLKETCKELGWKYDGLSKININKCTTTLHENQVMTASGLKKVFSEIIGEECDDKIISTVAKHFDMSVASYPKAYRYISLQLWRYNNGFNNNNQEKRQKLTRVENQYLESMKARQFSEHISSKTLVETYIPNEYYIRKNDTRDDLLLFLNKFMEGAFEEYINDYRITDISVDDVNTLIITASQCCGKSSLVAELLYEHTLNNKNYALYVANFRDESHKRKIVSIETICKQFEIEDSQLENSVIILDSIEESELPAAKIQDMIEILSSNLKDYRSKLIVTCRNNIINLNELEGCIEVRLCPFSENKIDQWIDACDLNIDRSRLDEIISSVKQEFSQVLCLPYILKICIEKDLIIGNIHDLGHLYDKAFIIDADLLYSRYDPHHRLTTTQVKKLKEVILDVAMTCIYSKERAISISDLVELCEPYGPHFLPTLESLFFLIQTDNQYHFLHESILNYFVAKELYDHLVNIKEKKDEDTAAFIKKYVKYGFLFPKNVYEFISHFATTMRQISSQEAVIMIKSFLSNKYEDYLKINGNYDMLKTFHYACYVFIVCLSSEIISSMESREEYDLIDMLDHQELTNLSALSNMGDADMDILGGYDLSNIVLKGFNFINTDFTNRKRRTKTIRNSNLNGTNFNGANMDGIYIIDSKLTMSSFKNAICSNIQINKCELRNCNFKNADLRGAIIEESDISCSDLRGAKLHKITFKGTNIERIIINSDQLKELIDFMPDYIRQNHICLYKDGCELPDELIEDEFANQRPAAYQVYIHPEIKKKRNRCY